MSPAPRTFLLGALVANAVTTAGCAQQPPGQEPEDPAHEVAGVESVERLQVAVRRSWPHDPTHFTQGLLWHDDTVFESIGRYGQSALVRWRLEDGQVVTRRELPDTLFGEGLALVEDRLYQLTWRNGRVLVWNLEAMQIIGEGVYPGEGWGLTWTGRHLVMSDGTSTLTFRDAETFAFQRALEVRRQGLPQPNLNELEWDGLSLWANVWGSEEILRIDPDTGMVTAVVDASGLLPAAQRAATDVFNGIAYRPDTSSFLVTGKLWPRIFEVDFVPVQTP